MRRGLLSSLCLLFTRNMLKLTRLLSEGSQGLYNKLKVYSTLVDIKGFTQLT
jgi:hypothetical protein